MNIKNLLPKVLRVGVFIVPFIPLLVTSFLFFPFITGKNFAFRILTELLFGGWILLIVYDPRFRPKFSWLLASILSFVGVIAIADIFGENPLKSIWSNFERMEGLVTLVHLLLYFLVISSVLSTEKLWTRFLQTSVGVSGLLGIYGLFQLLGFLTINQGGVRLDATFGNATYLAVYMLFHVFLTALLLLRYKGQRSMYFVYGGLLLLQVIMIYYTATRGAILGFLGGMVLSAILIALFERQRRELRTLASYVLIGVFLIVSGFFLIKDTQFVHTSKVLSRFSEISTHDGGINARFVVWEMARKGIQERPLLGWGQENFNYVFNTYYDPRLYAQEQWFDRVHNVVFDWLIAGGILGFLAYVSMFVMTLYYTWRRRNTFFSIPEKSVITGMLAGYTFHNLFVFDNLMSYVLFFTVMSYVYWSYTESTKEIFMDTVYAERDTGIVSRVYAPLIIILTLFSVYLVNGKGLLSAASLLQAIAVPAGHPTQIDAFKKTFFYNSFGNQEAGEQLSQIANRIAGSQLDVETKQAYLSLATSEMGKLVLRTPNDARIEIFAGTLLDAYGLYNDGLPHVKRALELSPKKATILFQLGLNTLNRGDVAGALEMFRRAFEFDTRYEEARIFYALGAIYAKDDALLESLLTPVYGSIIVDNDRLLQAYYNNRRFGEVLAISKLRAANNPINPQAHLALAAIYLELNQRENSVQEIENAIALDPNFKEQGAYLIQEIRAGRNP